MFLFAIIPVSFLSILKERKPKFFTSVVVKAVAGLFLLYNVWYAGNNIRARYGIRSDKLTMTEHEAGTWDWIAWDQREVWDSFDSLESFNRSLGIRPDDKVVCLPDGSTNTTLYLMNQPGWTAFMNSDMNNGVGMLEKIRLGAKYLIVYDSKILQNAGLAPYIRHKLGTYKNISVFALQK